MAAVFQHRLLGAALALSAAALLAPGAAAQISGTKDRNADWALGLADADPEGAWALFLDLTAAQADGSMAWEDWKATPQVFLPGGAMPAPWGGAPAARTLDASADPDGGTLILQDGVHLNSTAGPNFVDGGLRDLKGRPIYSEIRMNEVVFDAVVENGLYNVEGQLAFNAAGRNLSLPDGAIEVKVTWRILDDETDPALAATYLTTTATDSDGGTATTVRLGMTSMNVLAKRGGAWFATAFEHEANPVTTLDDLYPQVVLALRASANFEAQNAAERARLAGDPRGHYRAAGGQTDFVASDGGPIFLTNTQQETQLVRTSSCLSCHAYSGIGVFDGKPARLSPLATQNADGTATGYLSVPDAAVLARFSTFDMMWSVIEAQPVDPTLKVEMLHVDQLPPAR
jgi:hypothetical protein